MKVFGFILFCIGLALVSNAQDNSKVTLRSSRIQIDGPAKPNARKPLLFVNGIETDFESMVLAPNNIQQIDVLKDNSATSLYGSKGADGVILIKTKPGIEFYTLADFISAEKNVNTSVKQIELNGKLLTDMKKLLIEKKAFPSTTVSSDMKVDEKNCEMVFNDTLVIKTQYSDDKQ